MISFIFKRLLQFIPVLLVVVTVVFFLVRLAPGGPFDAEKKFPPGVQEKLEAKYNLNAPLHQQYFAYLGSLLRGDLGASLKTYSHSVSELIWMRLPVTMQVGGLALLVALTIGLTAGLLAAARPNSWLDHLPMSLAMTGICIPSFFLGPLLALIFAIELGWLPLEGWYGPSNVILPACTLGAAFAAYVARLSRGGMLEVMAQDFIRTARAKGLSEGAVVLRHGLRGGIQPVVSFMGPAIAGLLTGSFVVESIFQVPGLGREFIRSALNRDYTMLMGMVLFFSTLILTLNLVVDVVQAWLDPRVRIKEG